MFNKKILASIFFISILALALGWGTYAYFTDTETTTNNTFTAGTLEVDGAGFASFDLGAIADNMAPGDVTNYATIIIKNTGSLPLAWFGDWVITGGNKLRQAIYIDYAKMEFFKSDGITTWEPEDNFITDGVGSGPYPTWFNTLAASSPFGVVSLAVWDGNNGMGTTPYEHMGALKPGCSYKLTVRFGFAAAAGNEYQGDVVNPVNIKFKVDATQVNADALNALHSGFGIHLTWLNAQLAKQT
jgi:predicted ribosomally synthesized peptide with SipW-like signal peptide